MIKYLFIVINSLAVLFYSLFSDGGTPTVTGTFPPSIKAGQEANIELRVNKGTMNGFAKLQMELPEGLAPKETENKGANYTFSNGIAKWVWASLPPESEIVIKIKLVSSDEAAGVKAITAKFSYVENNAKQVVEMTPAEINITPTDGNTDAAAANGPAKDTMPVVTTTPALAETLPQAANTSTATEPQLVPADKSTTVPVIVETATVPAVAENAMDSNPVSNPPAASTSNAEPPGNIQVTRTVTIKSDGECLVKIKIKKGATKGFARYSDDLPEGLNIKPLKTEGSSFSIGDGKLKFVWVNVPKKEEMDLEYLISSTSPSPIQVAMNEGEYSYLEDNQSKKFKVAPETITITGGLAADSQVKAETGSADSQSASTQAALGETLARKEGDVNYHVQIGAFTNAKVDADRLKKVFHVTELISSEMQGGFSKFMVGSHNDYKDARDHRETMKAGNGIKSAFVVAYNGSKRITVQEALMITNQKWFK